MEPIIIFTVLAIAVALFGLFLASVVPFFDDFILVIVIVVDAVAVFIIEVIYFSPDQVNFTTNAVDVRVT